MKVVNLLITVLSIRYKDRSGSGTWKTDGLSNMAAFICCTLITYIQVLSIRSHAILMIIIRLYEYA